MKYILKSGIIMLFALLVFNAAGQQQQDQQDKKGVQKRPKIGLVLSGGGAKGVAHIGILKVMEEAGLTPDYITGTSMGSIMGGLYSIGYSADELKDIVLKIDWDQILTNKVPLDKVTFEEKQFYGRYLLDFYLKGKQLQFPSGVIEGQALMELFSEVTRPVHNITDFNKFPIPFTCVGTNIVTGEAVDLNKGSLAMAMRASMAIPSVFTPVKIDGKLLVDGGLVRNMPVDEVKEMGADIVIGVFVGTDLSPEEDLNSLVKILTQSAFITSAFDARKQLEQCDILIRPDLTGYSTSSFHEAPGILERGEEAGKQYVEVFRHLADSLRQFGPLHKVVKPEIQEVYKFDSIVIEGNKTVTDEFIIGKMKYKPGKEFTIEELNQRIEFTYGTQYFEKISYQILGEPGNWTLKLNIIERPNIQFRFSYFYDSENKGGIIVNSTFRNVILNNSRLILETSLSAEPVVFAEYFKYLGKRQNIALSLDGFYNNNTLPWYDSTGVRYALFSSNYITGGFKLQSTNFKNSTYGVGVNWSNIALRPKIYNNDSLDVTEIKYSNTVFTAFYKYNSINDRYFPTRGLILNIEASATTNTKGKVILNGFVYENELLELLDVLKTDVIKELTVEVWPYIPVTKKLTFISKAKLMLSNLPASTFNLNEYDFIGGFNPSLVNSNEYYGYGVKQYGLANYFYGRVGAQYELIRNLFLQAQFNILSTEFPVTFLYPNADTGNLDGKNFSYAYAGMIGYRSIIGPIKFAIAKDHYMKSWKAALIIGFHY